MAMESWNSASNVIVYDKNIYDEVTQTWTRGVKYPQTQAPSAQEAFVVYRNQHIQISTDIDTGFVTLSVKHQSPFIAKASVTFLNAQIAQTNFSEIKQVIAQLLQQKTQQLTLIEVSDFYVFEYLDPPAVMERKSEPRRSLICIFGAFLGGLFSILIVLIRHYAFNNKSL